MMASWHENALWNSDPYDGHIGGISRISTNPILCSSTHDLFTIVPIHEYVLCMASGSETNYICVQSINKPFSLRYNVVDKVFTKLIYST